MPRTMRPCPTCLSSPCRKLAECIQRHETLYEILDSITFDLISSEDADWRDEIATELSGVISNFQRNQGLLDSGYISGYFWSDVRRALERKRHCKDRTAMEDWVRNFYERDGEDGGQGLVRFEW